MPKKRDPENRGQGQVGPEPEPRARREPVAWVCLTLVACVFLLYAQVASHDFVSLDDLDYIVENPPVRRGLTWDGVYWAFTTFHRANWHPLTWVSHMVDCQLFGLSAGWHHMANVALHALNAALLFVSLRFMTGAFWPSALVGALFAFHPLRVESVAWASERKDVLSALFWILTTLAYAWYVRRPAPSRYLAVFLALALGLMPKPMLVTLPVVLLVLDVWPFGRWRVPGRGRKAAAVDRRSASAGVATRSARWLVLEKLPLLALSAAASLITIRAQQAGLAVAGLEEIPLWSRFLNAAVACSSYLGKTVWPADLAVFYPHPALLLHPGAFPSWGAGVTAALAVVGVTVAVISAVDRRPYLAVGWLWYLIALLPVVGIVQVGSQAMADRYSYLPLVGIYMMLAWGARDVSVRRPRARPVLVGAAALALVGCVTATWVQIATWRNSFTLYEHAIRVTTGNYFAHANLGILLRNAGRLDEAADQLEKALHIKPDDARAHTNLGTVLEKQGRLEEAVAQHREALRIKPDYAKAHTNLGAVYAKQGKLVEATRQFREAVRLRPDYALAHTNLGGALIKQNRLEEAAAHLGLAVRIQPDSAGAHNNLGVALTRQGKLVEAAARFERALVLEPDHADARKNLAYVRKRLSAKR